MPAAFAIAGSAVLGYMGSQDAASSARDAANAQMQNQREMNSQNLAFQEKWNTLNDPFSAGGHRQQYVDQLNTFMKGGGPSQMYNDPVFQNQLQMGQEAISRRFGASGQGGSGAEAASLMQYTTGAAQNEYQNQYSRLASLSGAGGVGHGTAFQGTTPQGMTPGMAGGIAAAPYNVGASALSTLGGIYSKGGGGGSGDYNYGSNGSGLDYDAWAAGGYK